jgi:hypothetical protein
MGDLTSENLPVNKMKFGIERFSEQRALSTIEFKLMVE